ncbi:hypothetical protein [Paenibacillus sp. OV219]|uniref:hypothetical protein n=1 Tax=Paenibacillus sp. OV219 TaxID=1884377 RepID=UPI0008C00813|nr:hypothetical protein [Paenibacillus sp. OV219]SEN79975.1 hypothetical protein SAMN05518847_104171 [Paenibacillus sp. OV219]
MEMNNNVGNRLHVWFRLSAAVLITASMLVLAAGCGHADTNDANTSAPLRSADPTTVSDRIESGTNPFEVAGIRDPKNFLTVFNTVKDAIASGDQAEVASHILYPLRVNSKSGTELYQTRADFVQHYDEIITEPVKKAIANQSVDQLFVNYQGVMVGNGDIWFGGSSDKEQVIGIIAINHDF